MHGDVIIQTILIHFVTLRYLVAVIIQSNFDVDRGVRFLRSYEGQNLRVSHWKDIMTLATLPYTTTMACDWDITKSIFDKSKFLLDHVLTCTTSCIYQQFQISDI